MRRIELARSAGFCYGVTRAVDIAEASASEGTPCVMLGSIIHNDREVERLRALGLGVIDSPEEAPRGARVIIRSHGESKAVFDALEKRGCTVLDATCPNVTHIHKIVREAEENGRQPVIIGTRDHPEIRAIAGWCTHPAVFEKPEELSAWLEEIPARKDLPLTFVSQTTSTRELWDSFIKIAKKECTNAKIFDTICGATAKRQEEAKTLASACDAMVVIGDRKSSNTRRLAELCRDRCLRVIRIENAEELDWDDLAGAASIGITAGASAPAWIIKEVYNKMSEENMEIEESFADLLEKSIKTLNTGDKVTGIVTGISPTEISVDLGTKHAGFIPASELSDDPSVKPEDICKVGDEIEVFVTRVNDQEGVATLSKKRLDAVKNWEFIEEAKENKTTVEGLVTEENKGGIVVSVKGVRVFVPASQSGLDRGVPMTQLVKTQVKLRITEVNRARHRVVGSIKAVQYEERAELAEKVWESIEVGKKYTGVVKSMTSYGAFVDIGGVDGMVHISELSWSRIKHPSEVVSIGQTVEVYVISFDPEKKKISLGMKDRSEDPWTKFIENYAVGDVVNVKVVKLMTFGAFAEIIPSVDGLIHISQIADHRIEKPGDVLSEGQMVDAKITAIEPERKRISLSIRALLEEGDTAPEDEPEE